MSKSHEHKNKPTAASRVPWLDDASDAPLIHQYAEKLSTFVDAMADGKIDSRELKDQEARVVDIMKKVEPRLEGELHEDVTRLICELTAYNVMHTLHELMTAAPSKTKFRG